MNSPRSNSTKEALVRALDLVAGLAEEATRRADKNEKDAELSRQQLLDCSAERAALYQRLVVMEREATGAVNPVLVPDPDSQMQDDMAVLMEVLGIPTHARPVSPHEVMVNEVIPKARAIMEAVQAVYQTRARVTPGTTLALPTYCVPPDPMERLVKAYDGDLG